MSNQYLSFDVTKQSAPQQLITGRQGDSRLKFVTMLFWDGDKNVPYDLTGKQVAFEALKPDNTHIVDYEGITILDAPAGLVRYSFNEQVFSVAGTMQQAFFKITHTDSDNNVITDSTLEVAINILENRVEFGINSTDYLSEYDDLIVQVKKKFDDYAATVQDSIDKAQALHDQIVNYTNLINSNSVILRSDFGDISSIKQPLGQTFVDKLNNEFNDRGVNVKWFGAKGDGTNNDTAAFEAAYLNSKNIYIPAGTYYLTGFHVPDGTKIIGDNAILELHSGDKTGSNNVLAGSQSNSIITGLKIHSLEENLEWNRFDISSQNHIIIRNCEFTGFRHVSNAPNAWGIYLEESKQISIENCQFDNNSQSDIAILDGCEDIQINGCSGINNTFYINFEPNNYADPIERVSINNCVLSKLSLRNYYLTNQNFEQISVTSSVIDHLDYYGADVEFISSKINYVNKSLVVSKPTDNSTISSGGVLKLNGALNLSSNLVVDPTMDSYATVTADANWTDTQGTLNASGGTTRYEDQFGALTRIGTKTTDRAQLLFSPKLLLESANNNRTNCYKVTTGDQFLATLAGWAHYDATAVWVSTNASADFYDDSGKFISTVHLSLCKAQMGTDSPYNKYSAFIIVPDNATGMKLKVGECTVAQSVTALYFGAFSLQKILTTTNASNGDINLHPLPVGSRRRFRSATCPSSNYGWCHYQEGDICYNSVPIKGQPYGWICVNQGYPGDWLPLGNI